MNKVFVDVDTQCDFMNPGGALYVPGAEQIKEVLAKITKLAKDEKIPILKTFDCHIPNDKEFEIFPPHCIDGTVGQASIRETSSNNAVKFDKSTYNIFDKKLGNSNFEKWLVDNKIKTAYVYGVATDYCVKEAVIGLCKMGITTYVFENAIAGVTAETTEIAKKEMRKAGALLAIAKL